MSINFNYTTLLEYLASHAPPSVSKSVSADAFDAALQAAVAKGAQVVRDFRGHNSYGRV